MTDMCKVMKNLKQAISIIDQALVSTKSGGKTSTLHPSKGSAKGDHAVPVKKASGHETKQSHVKSLLEGPAFEAGLQDPSSLITNLTTTMSANKDTGLGSVAPSLVDMATSIKPIIDSFDDVLVYCCTLPAYHNC